MAAEATGLGLTQETCLRIRQRGHSRCHYGQMAIKDPGPIQQGTATYDLTSALEKGRSSLANMGLQLQVSYVEYFH